MGFKICFLLLTVVDIFQSYNTGSIYKDLSNTAYVSNIYITGYHVRFFTADMCNM